MRLLALALTLIAGAAMAGPKTLPGWAVHKTSHGYEKLIDRVKAAAKRNKMGVVTQAGPTGAAKRRGVVIPGNRVIGLFNNVFAVEMLEASVNAMIEAPVRMYVTEDDDGAATLSYKTPGHVFSPYASDDPKVMEIAGKLDAIFAEIAREAAN